MSGISIRMADEAMSVLTVDGGSHVATPKGSFSEVGVLHPGERVDLLINWSCVTSENSSFFNINLDRQYVEFNTRLQSLEPWQ